MVRRQNYADRSVRPAEAGGPFERCMLSINPLINQSLLPIPLPPPPPPSSSSLQYIRLGRTNLKIPRLNERNPECAKAKMTTWKLPNKQTSPCSPSPSGDGEEDPPGKEPRLQVDESISQSLMSTRGSKYRQAVSTVVMDGMLGILHANV